MGALRTARARLKIFSTHGPFDVATVILNLPGLIEAMPALPPQRRFLITSLAIAVMLILISCTARGAENPTGQGQVCVLLTREGKVEVSRKGTTQWSEGQTNQVLQLGDRLRTGMRSRATLRWSDLRDRKSTRLNSSHGGISRMPSSA